MLAPWCYSVEKREALVLGQDEFTKVLDHQVNSRPIVSQDPVNSKSRSAEFTKVLDHHTGQLRVVSHSLPGLLVNLTLYQDY